MAFWTFFIFVTILICLPNIRCNECVIHIKADMLADSPSVVFLFSQNNPQTKTHAIHDNKYLYPSDSWNQPGSAQDPKLLILKQGANVQFICPLETVRNKVARNKPGVMTIKGTPCSCSKKDVKCIGNNKFEVVVNMKKENIEFKDVKCEYVDHTSYAPIQRDTKKECEDMTPANTPNIVPTTSDTRLFEILYDLGNNDELKTIELCHDTEISNTLWAHSFIIPESGRSRSPPKKSKSNKKRKDFMTGDLFNHLNWAAPNRKTEELDSEITAREKMKEGKDTKPYSKMGEWKTARFLLGNAVEADKYFCAVPRPDNKKEWKYLARGHLIANADKLYKIERDSTYFYANVLPMWESFNESPGNWYVVESTIRDLAFAKKRKYLIWTGGIGVLELPNAQGRNVKFYLDPVGRPRTSSAFPSPPKKRRISYKPVNKIPAPMVIFKIAVDEETKEALVFLVINHPDVDPNNVDPKFMVCPKYVKADDPCWKDGVFDDTKDKKDGYGYCCKLKDFYDTHADHLRLKNRLAPYTTYAPLTLT